jgi:hypothetical protein
MLGSSWAAHRNGIGTAHEDQASATLEGTAMKPKTNGNYFESWLQQYQQQLQQVFCRGCEVRGTDSSGSSAANGRDHRLNKIR